MEVCVIFLKMVYIHAGIVLVLMIIAISLDPQVAINQQLIQLKVLLSRSYNMFGIDCFGDIFYNIEYSSLEELYSGMVIYPTRNSKYVSLHCSIDLDSLIYRD